MAEIPNSELKIFAEKHDLEQLIIIGRKTGANGKEVCSTWGSNFEHAQVAMDIGDYMKYKVMGWKK